VIAVPFAHVGHALPLLPFFAPPLIVTLGIVLLIVRDRLRGDAGDEEDERESLPEPGVALRPSGTPLDAA
jgi:hypothetical protein